ncbi:zinc finger, CCHC-type containing protein [Tanacetum coccineum]|uniref:Zinc finger, CCHC-type containing protein n=1 Tax=Tanacetum coccineum TaxID=301880 RepID=A0ABQ5GQP8_9ASTR
MCGESRRRRFRCSGLAFVLLNARSLLLLSLEQLHPLLEAITLWRAYPRRRDGNSSNMRILSRRYQLAIFNALCKMLDPGKPPKKSKPRVVPGKLLRVQRRALTQLWMSENLKRRREDSAIEKLLGYEIVITGYKRGRKFSIEMELIASLNVKILALPAANEVGSIWTNKFWFQKIPDVEGAFQLPIIEKGKRAARVMGRNGLFNVNGEPIFIQGGNWIMSDGLLRLPEKCYKRDIKFHVDMNFNMTRCWGCGLAETCRTFIENGHLGLRPLVLKHSLKVVQVSIGDSVMQRPRSLIFHGSLCLATCTALPCQFIYLSQHETYYSTVEAIRIRAKWENGDYICRGYILNGMYDSLFDVYTNVELAKELWDSLESKYMAEDYSRRVVFGPNLVSLAYRGISAKGRNDLVTRARKCGKTGHFKRDCRSGNKKNANAGGSGKGSKDHYQDQGQNLVPVWNIFVKFSVSLISEAFYVQVDAIAWWIDFSTTTHVCKDRCWFKTYEPVEDGSILYMGDDHFAMCYRGGEYYDPVFFQSVGIIHETTSPYTPQQNGVAERKYRALEEMVNSMLSYSESRDAIFDENHFFSIPRPKDIIPNSDESQRDDHYDDVPSEIPEPRKGKRVRKAKSYCSNFQLYLVEGSRDQVGSQYSYCYSIEEDPRTYNEAMQSRDFAYWKEAIDDEFGSIMENNTWVLSDLPPGCKPLGCKWIFKRKMKVDGTIDNLYLVEGSRDQKQYDDEFGSIMENNTWVLSDLPPGCKPLGCKWIFKRKMKVDGTIDKFKARLVIQGFRQKEGIDYFDTYSQFAQEVYMKQPEGFVMPGNEHKVCKLVKSLYGLKQAPKQWHQKFDEVVLSSGFLLNQSDKFVLFGESSMDPVEKLKPNTGKPVDQLEYSRAIGCLMYAMTSTRPDIAYAVGRLSRFTSNPSRQHWQAITRVFKYLKGTMNYGLSYVGYPSVLEAYSDASWINHVEDYFYEMDGVFSAGGSGFAISWASRSKHASLVLL